MAIVLINETPTEVGSGADEIIRLRAENAALKAELAKEEEAHFRTHNWLIDRNEELASAEKVREGLIKCYTGMAEDAKRYRWLRDDECADVRIHYVGKRSGAELDAAIDNAMQKVN